MLNPYRNIQLYWQPYRILHVKAIDV